MGRRKNPIRVFCQCVRAWNTMRRYPGVFRTGDATMNLRDMLLPSRFYYRAAGEALAREARIERVSEGVHKVTVLRENLSFYWLGQVTNNLYASIAQEFDPECPHYYTTPPIKMTPESLVLDVGACEGLLAYRLLKKNEARRVICFEPSERVAAFTRRGAVENGVGDRLAVETMAVSDRSGQACFIEGDTPEANRIVSESAGEAGRMIPVVALDDYCAQRNIRLGKRDLIKIDAEGADLDILRGAERVIREGGPQIAVTTYHNEQHAPNMVEWLEKLRPDYQLRLKGFCFWGGSVRPVLLQAAR